MPRVAAADTITLTWDANQDPGVAGYVVYAGTQPGSYTQQFDVGPTTTFVFPSATPGQRYCFAVSAYASGPVEGPTSTEVCGYADQAPVLADPGSQATTIGQVAALQLAGSDPDGMPVSYSAIGLPPGLSVMASTGLVSGTPTTAGSYTVTATVSDGVLTASRTFTWTIAAADVTPPAITITSPTSASTYVTGASTISLGGTAGDDTGVTQVTWVNSRGGSGVASGTTSWSAAVPLSSGSNVLTVRAFDPAGNSGTDVLTVTVNVAPALAPVGTQSSTVGQPATLQLSGSDANGDPLTYAATGLPPGLAIAPATGLIAGTPTTAGSYAVTATVSDGQLTASRSFTWTVTTAPPAPPTAGGLTLAWDATTDPAVVGYKVHVGPAPGVYTQVIDVGLVTTWSLPSPVPGQQYCFAVSAYSASLESGLSTEVCGYSDQAPTLAPVANQTTLAGQAVSLQLVGSDPDGMAVSYLAGGLPPGLAAMVSTGLIAGVPTTAGSYAVTATVSDGQLTASRSFTWTVTPAPPPPPTAGGLTLAWDATTDPAVVGYKVHVGTTTGVYTQVIDVGLVTTWSLASPVPGQRYCFAVSAYSASLESGLSTEVCGYGDEAPTLAPVANQTTLAGQAVSLQLVGSDPDGVAVTYLASGLPPGLAVMVSTGLIAGVPTTAGSYLVTATVSDGTLSASRSFTWTVTAPADTTAPVVTITAPTSSPTHATSALSVTLGGWASDNAGVTNVQWTNDRGGGGVATGTTSWSAAVALQSGVNVLTVTARDAAGNSATDVLTVTVSSNQAPALDPVEDKVSWVDVDVSLQLGGHDANGDTLTYAAVNLPAGLWLNPTTGVVSGSSPKSATGTYTVTVSVTDGALTTSRTFTWTVLRGLRRGRWR